MQEVALVDRLQTERPALLRERGEDGLALAGSLVAGALVAGALVAWGYAVPPAEEQAPSTARHSAGTMLTASLDRVTMGSSSWLGWS